MVSIGDKLDPEALIAFLAHNGYVRAETVMEPGEYAVRGGIIDLFPPAYADPLRLDFFGDELDGIRSFDSATQLTAAKLEQFVIRPVSEVRLDDGSVALFRSAYRGLFGAVGGDDPLYAAVSAGRRHVGMEHWLPLYHASLDTLFDYVPGAAVILDHQAEEARDARFELIADYYGARCNVAAGKFAGTGSRYSPVPPERMFLDRDDWDARLAERAVGRLRSGYRGRRRRAEAPRRNGSEALLNGRRYRRKTARRV